MHRRKRPRQAWDSRRLQAGVEWIVAILDIGIAGWGAANRE